MLTGVPHVVAPRDAEWNATRYVESKPAAHNASAPLAACAVITSLGFRLFRTDRTFHLH